MQGFATATVLLLTSLIASAALWASQEALTGSTLSTIRAAQLRTQMINEAAIAGAMRALATTDPELPADQRHSLPIHGDVGMAIRRVHVDPLPEDFSATRFISEHLEITASSTAPPGARAAVTQGAARIVPAGTMP